MKPQSAGYKISDEQLDALIDFAQAAVEDGDLPEINQARLDAFVELRRLRGVIFVRARRGRGQA